MLYFKYCTSDGQMPNINLFLTVLKIFTLRLMANNKNIGKTFFIYINTCSTSYGWFNVFFLYHQCYLMYYFLPVYLCSVF